MRVVDMAGQVALAAGVVLLSVWVIYPLVIRGIAALVGRRAGGSGLDPLPAVTVVLASREPPDAILARIDDLLGSDYPAELLDVVIGLDLGAEAPELGSRAARVRLVGADAPGGKACALNAAVRASTGALLVFTDTHQRFERDAIRALAGAFAEPRVGAASGALLLPAERHRPTLAEWYWRYERRLRRAEARLHSSVGVTGAIYALRRALWRPLPAGLLLDDLYVPMRIVLEGHRVDFVDAARATDARRTNPQQEYRRKVRTLTGNVQLCLWLPAVLDPLRNPIWVQLVFHKLLRLLTPYLLLVLAVALPIALSATIGPVLPAVLWTLAVLAVWCLAGLDGLARRLRSLVIWGVSLQAATLVATVNGLRGRWDVWRS